MLTTIVSTGAAAAQPSGASGAGGFTGATGSCNPTGFTGASGATGSSAGATGTTGATGPTGASGTSGASEPGGATGASGASGTTGPTGASGTTGATGASGTTGATGASGTTGATGPTGASGASSSTGAAIPPPTPAEQKAIDANLIISRPAGCPSGTEPVVLVAAGDSVTSAQQQTASGVVSPPATPAKCLAANYTDDGRKLPGDDGDFSYAGLYTKATRNVVAYYNFARTGFGTDEVINAGAKTEDSCGNAWTYTSSPARLAAATIQQAHAKGQFVVFVASAGVNDTNSSIVLAQIVTCQLFADLAPVSGGTLSFKWDINGGKVADAPLKGGSCEYTTTDLFGRKTTETVKIDPFNGAAKYATINKNVTKISDMMLAAGANRVVWMQYYDLRLARIDINAAVNAVLKSTGAGAAKTNVVNGWLKKLAPIQSLIPIEMQPAAIQFENNLNNAIFTALPRSRLVRMEPQALTVPEDIQNTVTGGTPHPSAAGQQKMAKMLATVLGQMPSPAPVAGRVVEYPLVAGSNPAGIAVGPRKDLFVGEYGSGRVAEMTTLGNFVEYFIPSASNPRNVVMGSDGRVWFTDPRKDQVGAIAPDGTVTLYPFPKKSEPWGIASGPDGNLWVASQGGGIFKLTPNGVITAFASGGDPLNITTGPDGNLWVTEPDAKRVARVTPAGAITNFALTSFPSGITTGSDGNLWVTEPVIPPAASKLARVTPAGAPTQFAAPGWHFGITNGPDSNLWSAEDSTSAVDQFSTKGVLLASFKTPTPAAGPLQITTGPDMNIWFTEYDASKVGVRAPPAPAAQTPETSFAPELVVLAILLLGGLVVIKRRRRPLAAIAPIGEGDWGPSR